MNEYQAISTSPLQSVLQVASRLTSWLNSLPIPVHIRMSISTLGEKTLILFQNWLILYKDDLYLVCFDFIWTRYHEQWKGCWRENFRGQFWRIRAHLTSDGHETLGSGTSGRGDSTDGGFAEKTFWWRRKVTSMTEKCRKQTRKVNHSSGEQISFVGWQQRQP